MRNSLILAVATAAVIAPGAASARDRAPSVRVSYADLDLSTPNGRAQFDRRLVVAVKRVCPAADIRDLVGKRVSRDCAAEAHAKLKPLVAAAVKSKGMAVASAARQMPSAQ